MNNTHLSCQPNTKAAPDQPTNEQLSAAIQWLVQFETGAMEISAQQAFGRWLAENPQHPLAWERLGKASQHFLYAGAEVGSARPMLQPLSADIALQSIQHSDTCLQQKRRSLKILAAATGLGMLGWFSRDYTGLNHAPASYHYFSADLRTEIGKQYQKTLDDGSLLILNTRTAVDIDLQALPQINLLYGELSLAVKNPANPLRLRVGNHLFIPEANSEFTLNTYDQSCQLNVVSGSVNGVLATGQQQRIAAGQRLTHSKAGVTIDLVDRHALSWRQGVLSAERHQLGDFLQQLSRYRPGYLDCADEVAALSLSGSFPIANTELILENLCQILPVRQQRFSRYWVRLMPA